MTPLLPAANFGENEPQAIAVIVACLVWPLVAVYVMAAADGLVNLNSPKRSKQPNVAITFIGPCIALCLRAIVDVQFRHASK